MTKSLRCIALAALLVGGAPAFAEDAPREPPRAEAKPLFTFAFHGAIGGSVYAQDGLLGPSGGGQGSWVQGGTATGTVAGSGDHSQRNMVFSGDVRSTKLNFSMAGPNQIFFGATPKGLVEVDFFGGNGSGNFGSESVVPRLRIATANLEWEGATLMVGQWHQFANGINTLGVSPLGLPEWVGHTIFPVTNNAGTIAWRYPGIFLFERFKLGSDTKIEVAANVAKSAWANVANPGTVTVNMTSGTGSILYNNPDFDLGAASAVPQVEGRVMIASGRSFAAMVGGHFSAFNPGGTAKVTGTGACAPTTLQYCPTKVSAIGDFGVMAAAAGFTFKGHAWFGQNASNLSDALSQYQTAVGLTKADVPAWGAFGQLGYNFTRELSLWALVGTEQLDFDKAWAAYGASNAVRLGNVASQGMLRWKEEGWAAAVEVSHWHTRYAYGGLDATQYMLSSFYFF